MDSPQSSSTARKRKGNNTTNSVSKPDSPMSESNKQPKKLSCQRCRSRKVKCNFEIPCNNCLKAGVECVQTTDDMRKKRPAANYVSNLENKVESLTRFMKLFKSLDSIESKTDLINKTDLNELMNKEFLENKRVSSSTSVLSHSSGDHHDEDEDRAFYGPTSIYDDNLMAGNSKLSKKDRDSSVISRMNKDPDILACLKLFFTWQYPDHNMFIFREAFLLDFFNPKPNSLYCSKILVLSICALGARMSDDEKIYDRSMSFYQEAKSLLLSQLSQPSITSLQSFMLLAFYDICNGLNSSGWMLSGNGMRMGFDLGFQLNPRVWFLKSKESLSSLDVEIRSRIYWGCYMADHFISLLLGRPSVLKLSDSSIPETNDLPDLEWIDDFTYEGYTKQKLKILHQPQPKVSYISDPLNKIINLINISDNMLNDIFTKSDSENDDSNNDDLDFVSRWEKLTEYNYQIMNWKNTLPDDLQWNREKLKLTGENPTYSGIRYYYYILLLCLNRPFVGIESDRIPPQDHYLSPLSICSNAIDDLYESIKKFQTSHGYRRVSIFIVYSSILSISIILLTNTSEQLVNEKKDRLQFFMAVLYGCSKTWKLAEKSYNLIKIKLKHRYETGELQESESMTQAKKRARVKLEKPVIPMALKANLLSSNHADLPIMQSPQPAKVSVVRSTYTPSNPPSSSSANLNPSPASSIASGTASVVDTNADLVFDENIDFLGGPPVLMTSDLFNEDWEALFPDYIFNSKH
ncbi:uncharacterized protein J8A68_002313 [[Candida] subhashii]|uniref:Zn(2)-C6 fungal-type domain-containing protein n=1 Tax=[Candida] subhashii TaxID=561895 RepID=A0A8J5UY91_9ASCO|nr:uncharacterized protein J8A68_002313 [[Candida] subhashii]KAG7664175.1 hypothetical protein J8A68_002313 [[Candida] subhashii]